MLKDHNKVMDELKEYASPKARITRLIKSGKLIQMRRGLFIDDTTISGRPVAPLLYGPSYLSFQYALFIHGLIPERVFLFTSATYNKNKDKTYHTPLGDFAYYYLPAAVYPYGIVREVENGLPYLIAVPEKALCDSLYKISGITTIGDVENLIVEDWRIEKEDLLQLDIDFMRFIAPLYRTRTLRLFMKWLNREIRNA